MALKKVAPTTQWPTRKKGGAPAPLNIVSSAESTYVLDDSATADAVATASGDSTFVINDDTSKAKKRIVRVGTVSVLILS